jgi:hypothetical protein
MGWLWTKTYKANHVPADLRKSCEQYGETVVAQILGRRIEARAPPEETGTPEWSMDHAQRQLALDWLREQHNRTERHQWWSMRMELGILVLVAVEVYFDFVRHR